MATQEEIQKKLLEILTGPMGIKAVLTPKTALLAESIMDSLEFMNYVFAVEEAFHLRIPESDLDGRRLGVIENMASYLLEKPAS